MKRRGTDRLKLRNKRREVKLQREVRPTASTPPSPVTAAGSSENDGEGGRVLVRGKEARFREEKRQGRGCRRRRVEGHRSRVAEERREGLMRGGRRRREFGSEGEGRSIYIYENYQ